MKPLVAICVGHSRRIHDSVEGGAVSVDGTNEWTFNSELANRIRVALALEHVSCVVVDKYEGDGYGAAQRWLAKFLKDRGATLAIELHFNSADDPAAHGHEWLCWVGSSRGLRLAHWLDTAMRETFPNMKARGVKPLSGGDRGAEFLRGTHCPACIAEPLFGSSPSDWKVATEQKQEIAEAISAGIVKYLASEA